MLCDIRFKHASDDLFQAAKTLLEKGCFAGAIIILSFTGFESTCKRQIRNLLIKRKNMSQKEADEYIEEKQIVKLCKARGKITNKEIQDLLGVHRNTATVKLKEMVLKGLLVQNGNRRYAYYVLNVQKTIDKAGQIMYILSR